MEIKYYCHAYKWKIFYVGWVMVWKIPRERFWYDNTPIENVYESRNVSYMTIGFNLEKVIARLRTWCEKNSEKESN